MTMEIPQWSWYNGRFLFAFQEALETDNSKSLGDFFGEFKENNELTPPFIFQLKNQGVIISLLYTLLVIPRETWENNLNTGTSFSFKTRENFKIEIGQKTSSDNWEFLRLMRNSISHANFSINVEQSEYCFWNENNSNVKNFKATISHEGIGKFITEIGKYYINEVSKNA